MHKPMGQASRSKQTDPFYGTQQWKRMRSATLSRDGFQCVRCGRRKDGLIVHHIVERKAGGVDAMHNLETLCRICHATEHPTPRVIAFASPA